MAILKRLRQLFTQQDDIRARLDRIQLAIGRIELRQLRDTPGITEAEFQVFSQWGEDGIIQYLIHRVPVARRIFVEFGVQNYEESNTRFLLQNDNWSGVIIDGSQENVEHVKRDPIYWKYNIKAECAFVDRDNIDTLLRDAGVSGDIGLLSIDIDGNDFWVWKAIESITPRIVIVEYNGLFGPTACVTIPYNGKFQRTRAHYSNLYWGASLGALEMLGNEKGYALVGSNKAGNNAFFVRKDVLHGLAVRTSVEAYVEPQFRESRSENGALTYLDRRAALDLVADIPVYDVKRNREVKIGEIS